MSTGTKRPPGKKRKKKDSHADTHTHPRGTLGRISDLRKVLRGLGEHHVAGGTSIEVRQESIAFVTELAT